MDTFIENIEYIQPKWLAIARREMGQKEIAGDEDNPRILEYHATTSLKATDDEVPWCSAFVNFCIEAAGKKGTKSARARSWLSCGKEIRTPAFGCIVVISRGTAGQGHVGFFAGYREDTDAIAILGGNQNDEVNVSWFARSRLLGYRWPD